MINKLDLLENIEILTKIPEGENFICLYSGGKDCALALSLACEKSTPVALINCVDNEESLFHGHSNELTEIQSKKMRIPVVHLNSHFKDSIKMARLYRRYKKEGVTTVVFGDLKLEDNACKKIKLCKTVGLQPCMPLLEKPLDELIEQIIKYQIKSLLTVVRTPLIGDEWLGKIFDKNAYDHFKDLGIDPFGENGEFHTTLIGANIFSSDIDYDMKSISVVTDKFGDKRCADIIYRKC